MEQEWSPLPMYFFRLIYIYIGIMLFSLFNLLSEDEKGTEKMRFK